MDKFVVPQFIEVEDKIFGPITTRQFLILLAAGIILFITFKLADIQLFILTALLVGGLAIVFAFVKVNGQTFHYFVLNIIQTTRRPSLRIWNKGYTKKELDVLRKMNIADDHVEETFQRKVVKKERMRDLALMVNTGGFYRPDQ